MLLYIFTLQLCVFVCDINCRLIWLNLGSVNLTLSTIYLIVVVVTIAVVVVVVITDVIAIAIAIAILTRQMYSKTAAVMASVDTVNIIEVVHWIFVNKFHARG